MKNPVLSLVFGIFLVSSAAMAQQGVQPMLGNYDTSKSLTKSGAITDLIWSNPHCLLSFDAKGDDGKVVNWGIELSNPRTMIAMSVTPVTLQPGKQVTVTFNPSTGASNRGLVQQIKMDDKVIFDASKPLTDLYNKPAAAPAKKK